MKGELAHDQKHPMGFGFDSLPLADRRKNRSSSRGRRIPPGKLVPHEVKSGSSPDFSQVRIFWILSVPVAPAVRSWAKPRPALARWPWPRS